MEDVTELRIGCLTHDHCKKFKTCECVLEMCQFWPEIYWNIQNVIV